MKDNIGHTPGPWFVDDDFCDTKIYAQREGRRANIVTGMYDEENEPSLKECLANAFLMATAPDMLRALEDAARHFENIAYEIKRGNVSNAAEIAKNNARYAKEVIDEARGRT